MSRNNRNRNKNNGNFGGDNRGSQNRDVTPESSNYSGTPGPHTKSGISNDSDMYGSESMVRDAASIPFSWATGAQYTLDPNNTAIAQHYPMRSMPGIMTFNLMPTYGGNDSGNGVLNMTAVRSFSYLRQHNSGARNYDQNSLLIYYLTKDSIAYFYAEVRRIYGLMLHFSSVNYYKPQYVVEALGFDYEDLIGKLPQLRNFLRYYARMANSFSVPSLPIFKRHFELFDRVYVDEDSERAQIYACKAAGWYKYQEAPEQATSAFTLQWMPRTEDLLDMDDIWTIGRELLLDQQWSQDHGIMSGDVEKAYGTDLFLLDTEVSDDYETVYDMSDEFAHEVMNMTVLPTNGAQSWHCSIQEDFANNRLSQNISRAQFTEYERIAIAGMHRLLNFSHEDVTPADIMRATRLTTFGQDAGTQGVMTFIGCGSEICVGASVFLFRFNNGGTAMYKQLEEIPFSYVMPLVGHNDQINTGVVAAASAISKFRFHPPVLTGTWDTGDTQFSNYFYPMGDYYKWTVLESEQLSSMNEVAIQALFGLK